MNEVTQAFEKKETRPHPAKFRPATKRYVELELRRRELEDELKAVKAEARGLEEEILNQFADLGCQNMNVDGLTLYIRQERWYGKKPDVTAEQVCDALNQCGFAYLVKEGYNANSLRGALNELVKNDEPIPEPLERLLNTEPVSKLGSRKS